MKFPNKNLSNLISKTFEMAKKDNKSVLAFFLIQSLLSLCHLRYMLVEVDSGPQGKYMCDYKFALFSLIIIFFMKYFHNLHNCLLNLF